MISDVSSAAITTRKKLLEEKEKQYVIPKFDFNEKEKPKTVLNIDQVYCK